MPPESPAKLALSISGGGHRAAAFGLGTIALLHELGLMERVAVISTVSGGSLVGGFYLCAKAGFLHDAEVPQQAMEAWRDDGFRHRFILPFLAFLHDGRLGDRLAGLIQSLSQASLPGLRAWVEVGGIAPFPCLKALLPQSISI